MAKGQYKHKEGKEASRFTHGLIKTRLYRIWSNMKTRCFNPNATRFEGWGGKGITICPEWKYDFLTFYDWSQSNGYSDELTLTESILMEIMNHQIAGGSHILNKIKTNHVSLNMN